MRMTRSQWLSTLPRVHARKKPVERKPRTPVRTWMFHVPEEGFVKASGYTKGEARAELRRKLKLDKLPAGTTAKLIVEAA